jgi:uncharacterized protein
MAGPLAGRALHSPIMDFIEAALANPINRAILQRLPQLGLGQPHLVAGCLYQSYWNLKSGRPVTEHIRDYDIFYFDDRDVSFEAEDAVIRSVATLTADLGAPIDVKNQARVHLWYRQRFGVDRAPLRSCAEAIATFTAVAKCVGIAIAPDGKLELVAPYGLADTLAGILRINPNCPNPESFLSKAETQRARWPWLTIVAESPSGAQSPSGN